MCRTKGSTLNETPRVFPAARPSPRRSRGPHGEQVLRKRGLLGMRRFFILAVVMAALAPSGARAATTGSIFGTVTGPSSEPIANVCVSAQSDAAGAGEPNHRNEER